MRAIAVSTAACAAALALAAPRAEAMCMSPRVTYSPDGGALRARPTLYRFDPSASDPAAIRVVGPDGPVAFRAETLASGGTDGPQVTAIHVDADAAWFVVIDGDPGARHHVYAIDPAAAATAPQDLVAAEVSAVKNSWTCASTRGISIGVEAPGVGAFLARWSDSTEAYLVPSTAGYYGRSSDQGPGHAEPFLGLAGCAGPQIPDDHIGRRDVTLTALYPDGTRVAVALPALPDLDQPIPPAPPRPRSPEPAPTPAPTAGDQDCGRSCAGGVVLAGGLVALAGVGLAALTLRRRRRTFVP